MESDVAMYAHDFDRATSAARDFDDRFYSNQEQRSLAVALASALRGDSASARLSASETIRRGQAELERRGGERSLDAFGRRSAVEAQMGIALALRGEREAAVRLAEKAAASYSPARDAMEGCYTQRWLAITYSIVGRRSDAVAVLRRLHGVPSCPTSTALRLDPMFDGLRADPEFQRLVAPGK